VSERNYVEVDESHSSETWVETYTRWGGLLLPTWPRAALIGAGGFMWGILTRLVERPGVELPLLAVIIALGCSGIPLMMHHRRRGSFGGFEVDLLALWGGFLAAVLLLEPTIWHFDNVVALTTALWSGSGAVGGMLVVFPDRGATADDDDA
jgi:hypothetical protein